MRTLLARGVVRKVEQGFKYVLYDGGIISLCENCKHYGIRGKFPCLPVGSKDSKACVCLGLSRTRNYFQAK